jgi:hypothetical protein
MTCEISLSDDSDLYFQLAGIDRADCTWNGHAITSMDTDAIESAIASRIHSFLVTEDENSGAYLRAIVNLAYRGSQGSTQQSLVERDIAELLNTPEGLLACGKDGVILPAGICKSTWKFCQKHSKAILIGVAVVAVVAAVVIVAAATGGAGAGAAGALGAMLGATGNDSMNHSPQDPRSSTHGQNSMSVESQSGVGNTIENRRSLADNLEGKSMGEQEPWTTSLIPSTPFRQPFESSWPASPPVNYNSFTPKDPFGFLSEVSPLLHSIPQQPDSTNRSIPFVLDPEYGVKFFADSPRSNDSISEKLKNFGAVLAHEALDGVSQVTSCVPQFLEEIKDIGNRILPPQDGVEITPMKNFENLVAAGHEKIDQVFATDQAGLYTPEAKEARDKFAIGIIPFPGSFGAGAFSTNKLAEAGKTVDRAGFTKAGRGLMKHGYREGSIFPKPTGNPAQVNEQGQKMLESILNHPEKKVVYKNTSNFGEVMDVHAPGIGGARFNSAGEMIGFLEP